MSTIGDAAMKFWGGDARRPRSQFDPNLLHGEDSEADLRPYRSLIELRNELRRQECSGELTTIVLILDERFCGDLPSMITRTKPGYRLTLTSLVSRLPGLATIGELAATQGALGWRQITFERDPNSAITGAIATKVEGERIVVFCPARLWQRNTTPQPNRESANC